MYDSDNMIGSGQQDHIAGYTICIGAHEYNLRNLQRKILSCEANYFVGLNRYGTPTILRLDVSLHDID